MAKFKKSKEGKRKGSRGRKSFDEYSKKRDSGRGRNFGRGSGRDRPRLEMTRVTCSSCGVKCEVPFKPTSNKPVYCSDCFEKTGSGRSSNKDLDKINEKLDKIMEALKIR